MYETKKMHNATGVSYEQKDDVFETAKKTLIQLKKNKEALMHKNLELNTK